MPNASADSTLGYAVGNLWLAPDGSLYKANQVSPAGNAAWQLVSPPPPTYPLQAAPGALAACSLDLLNPAYTANKAVDVLRASDHTTATIGFVNGRFDSATATAFLAGTTGTISKCYDQSGNGNDFSQATTTAQPSLVYLGPSAGWMIVADDSIPGTAVAHWLQATLATGVDPNNGAAMYWVGWPKSSLVVNGLGAIENTLNTFAVYTAAHNSPTISVNGVLQTGHLPVPSSPTVVSLLKPATTGNDVFGVNNRTLSPSRSTVTAGAETTVKIDQSDTTWNSVNAMKAIIFYAGATATANSTLITESLSAYFKVPFQTQPDIVVAVGDSITHGHAVSTTQNWEQQMYPMLNKPVTLYNLGLPAIQLTGTGGYLSLESGILNIVYSPTARNFIIDVLIGTNDLGATTPVPPATIYAGLQTFISNMKALGPNVRVNVGTILNRSGNATLLANIATLNASIRAGYNKPVATGGLGADGLLDYASDPVLSTCGTSTNVCSDNLHPTVYGYSFMAAIAAKATNLWLH